MPFLVSFRSLLLLCLLPLGTATKSCSSHPAFANFSNADGQGTCAGSVAFSSSCQLSCQPGYRPVAFQCDIATCDICTSANFTAPAEACVPCQAHEHSDGDGACTVDTAYTACNCTSAACTEAISIDKYFVVGVSDTDNSQCLATTIKQASDCPDGSEFTSANTGTANGVCTPCAGNEYSSNGATCQAHTSCGNQLDNSPRLSGESSTAAGSCDACANETYAATGNETCKSCDAVCGAGKVETTACSSSQNRVCEAGQCTSMPDFANVSNADGQGTCTGTLTHGDSCQLSCDAGHQPATYTCDTETLNAPTTACMVCQAHEHSDGDGACTVDTAYTACGCTSTACTEARTIFKIFTLGTTASDDSQCVDRYAKCTAPDHASIALANGQSDCSGQLSHLDSCSLACPAGFEAQTYECLEGSLISPEHACLCPAHQHVSGGACVNDTAYTACSCGSAACPQRPVDKFFSIGTQDNLDSSECRQPTFVEKKLGTATRAKTRTGIKDVFKLVKRDHIEAAENTNKTFAEKKEQFKSVIKYLKREIRKLPNRKVAIEKTSMVASPAFLASIPDNKEVDIVVPVVKTPAKLADPAQACDEADLDLLVQENSYDIDLDIGEVSLICSGNTPKTKLERKTSAGYEYTCLDADGGWTAATAVSEGSSYSCFGGAKFYVNSLGGTTCNTSLPVSQSYPTVASGTSACGANIGEGDACAQTCNANFVKESEASCEAGVFTPAVCSCVHDGYVDSGAGACEACPQGQFSTGGAACQPWTKTEADCLAEGNILQQGTRSSDSRCISAELSCGTISYLYFSGGDAPCCESMDNTISCMGQLGEDNMAMLDSLSGIKQGSGAACTDGMAVAFKEGKLICK